MKKGMLLGFACAALAACGVAAPSAKWVPAEADFVVAIQGQPDRERDVVRAWRTALTEAGVTEGPFLTDNQKSGSPLTAVSPLDIRSDGKFERFLTAFLGAKDNLGIYPAQSITLSWCLPEKMPEVQDSGFDFALFGEAYCIIENPVFDPEAAIACIDELVQGAGTVERVPQGDWQTIRPTAKAKAEQPNAPDVLGGWRPIPGGVVCVLGDAFAKADALLAGKAPSAAGDASVERLCAPAQYTMFRFLARDVKGLLKQFVTDPETAMQLDMSVGWLRTVSDFWVQIGVNETKAITLDIVAKAEDEESAAMVRDTFIAYKMMVGGLIVPQIFGAPDSQTSRWLMGTRCESNGTLATANLTLTMEQYCALWKEWEAISARMEVQDSLPAIEEPDAEPMTEEEARAILDAIDFEEE